MGYRSEVCLCLNRKGNVMLAEKLQEADPETKKLVEELLSNADKHVTSTNYNIWYWPCIKWYEDDIDVAFIERLLQEIPENAFRFLRIGDDLDDNEERGAFWDYPCDICITRSINFNTPMEN